MNAHFPVDAKRNWLSNDWSRNTVLNELTFFYRRQAKKNSAGDTPSGGDTATYLETERSDAPLSDPISVSVDINHDSRIVIVNRVFDEIVAG